MEQQKILWIILSVAVLLLAVLGTALFVFGPASSDAAGKTVAGKGDASGKFDPVEWARTGADYPEVSETEPVKEEEEFVVVYGDNVGKDELPPGISGTAADAAGSPQTAVVEVAVKKTEPEPAAKTAPAPAPVKTAAAVKAAPAPVKPKSTPAPAKTAPAPKAAQEYWIQAGSFSSMTRAEEARKLLVSKGFPAAIQTKTVDGKDFYRVRIGSYPAKEEAEKFLYWIKGIDGFSGSYVSQVQALR